MEIVIRPVVSGEGAALRDLRLRALADAPMAFGSTLAREQAFTDDVWEDRARGGPDRVTFIAERAGSWLAQATCIHDPGTGRPQLVGMFVDRDARGLGLAVRLVEAVCAWAAASGDGEIDLWVTVTNSPAIALYQKCGFTYTGRTQPLEHTPSLHELEMVRHLP